MAIGSVALTIEIDKKFIKDLDDAKRKIDGLVDKVNQAGQKTGQGFDGATKSSQKLGSEIDKTAQKLAGLGAAGAKSTQSLMQKFDTLGSKLNQVGGNIRSIGVAMAAATAPIAIGLKKSVESAIAFEDRLADVSKTTGAVGGDLKEIGDGLLNISKGSRTSVSALMDIAVAGGQMGVTKEEVVGFTDAIDKLSIALADEFAGGAEQVTKEVSILRNNLINFKTGNMQTDLLQLGNAINELGATGLATGEVIVDMSNRISGGTAILGSSAGNILGLSATLQELGVSTERAGSSVTRIYQTMARSTDKFAKTFGLNAKEFKKLVDTNIDEAFKLVLRRVGEMKPSTTELATMLKDVGLNGVYNSEVFLKLAGNMDLLNDRQALANERLKDTNSIMAEYNKKNNTTAANIAKFKNNVQALAITFGSTLLPTINKVITKIIPIIDKLAKKWETLNPKVQQLIIVFAGLAIASGPLLIIFGQLISSIGTIMKTVSGLSTVLGSAGASMLGWVAAIIAVIAVVIILQKKLQLFDPILNALKQLFVKVKNTWNNIVEAFQDPRVKKAWNELKKVIADTARLFTPLINTISNIVRELFGIKEGTDAASDAFVSTDGAVKGLTGTLNLLKAMLKGIQPWVEWQVKVMNATYTVILKVIKAFKAWLGNNDTKKKLQETKKLFDELKKSLDETWKAVEEAFRAFVNIFDVFNKGKGDVKKTKDEIGILSWYFNRLLGVVNRDIKILKALAAVFRWNAQIYTKYTAPFLKALVTAIVETIKFIWHLPGNIKKAFIAVGKAIGETFVWIKNTIVGIGTGIWKFFTETIPTKIREGVNKVKQIWDELPKKANELGIKIGIAIGTIIKFFIDLPGNIYTWLVETAKKMFEWFVTTKDMIVLKLQEWWKAFVDFLIALPGNVWNWLVETGKRILQFLIDTKNWIVTKTIEWKNAFINFFKELPGNAKTELGVLKTSMIEKLKEIAEDFYNWGKKIINRLIDGMKAVSGKVKDTIGGLFSGIGEGIGKVFSKGGMVEGYANGGIVKTAYASKGLFQKKGTDTVPAMLTPGELVLPRGIVQNLFGILRKITSLPNIPTGMKPNQGQMMGNMLSNFGSSAPNVNVNIDTVNARNEDEARKRTGDIGFMFALQARGVQF